MSARRYPPYWRRRRAGDWRFARWRGGDIGEMAEQGVNAAQPLARLFPLTHDNEMLIRPELRCARLLLEKADEPRGIGEAVVVEAQHCAFRSRFHFRHAGVAAKTLDRDDFKKVLNFARKWTEAIDELGGERVDLAPVDQGGDAAIKPEPHIEIGDVVLGYQHRCADRDLRRPRFLGLAELTNAAPRLGDRFLKKMLIELDAHFADVAGLLLAQEVASAANIKIVARQG